MCPCLAAPGASAQLTPLVCPPTVPSGPGSCRKRGEAASDPTAPSQAGQTHTPAQSCPHGEGLRGRMKPRGGGRRAAAQALAPSDLPEQQLSPFPFGHLKGDQGMEDMEMPPSSLVHGGQRPLPRCMAGNPSCPALGCGTTTNPKVTMQEPVGQTRMMEVASSSVPSSCSFSSFFAAASSPPLSTHSWSRARQSCGRRVLSHLQRGQERRGKQ